MNNKETLALWAQGKDAWNAWAKKLLDERTEMEKAGTWALKQDPFELEEPEPFNLATAAWMTRATADFDGFVFETDMDFAYVWFPYRANFNRTHFKGAALFGKAHFFGTAKFYGTELDGHALFIDTVFERHVAFSSSRFAGNALFFNAHFRGSASFLSTKFSEFADFHDCHFYQYCDFLDSLFADNAHFSAVFGGDARFAQVQFSGYASFSGAVFKNQVDFTAARIERTFTLEVVDFRQVPDFAQANFREAPRLDNISIPEVRGLWNLRSGISAQGSDLSGRYRALKRLAVQAHDHAAELNFFASELKSRRNLLRYSAGLLYELFADFGRCIPLPAIWLFLTWFLSACAYLGIHFARASELGRSYTFSSIQWIGHWFASLFTGTVPLLSCVDGSLAAPWTDARVLSVAKTLPYAGVVPAQKLDQVFACLYGNSIPSGVVIIGIGQLLLSLLLLFLFLLAVRNHFRIR